MKSKIFLLFSLFLSITTGFSQVASKSRTFNLDTAIQTAILQNPLAKSAEFEVKEAGLTVKEALAARNLPQLNFNLFTGLVPEARGNIFYSPDKSDDLDNFGPFYRVSFELVKPIYAFGRFSSLVDAARQKQEIEQSKKDLILENLSFEVVKAYWGLSSALKAESLAHEIREIYTQFLAEVQERVKDEASEVDDSDLFEAKTFGYGVEEIHQESLRLKILAAKAFNALLDLSLEEEVSTSDEQQPEFRLDEKSLGDLIQMAEEMRPEVKGLTSALQALQAMKNFKKSQRLPVFFIAGGFEYGRAPNRADQTNPFVLDNFNYRRAGLALGLNWNPNILPVNIEIQKVQTEYDSTLEKLNALKAKIAFEVSQAFAEARKNDALLMAARKALQSAKSWVRVSTDNWNMGIGEVWQILRSFEAYYRLLGKELEKEYQNHVSLANLAFVAGDIDLYLKWVKDGQVRLN